MIRIMSSNIWGNYFGNPVEERQDGLYTVFRRYNPDVLGFQESTEDWNNSELFAKLKKLYTFSICPGQPENNYLTLMWRTDLFDLIDNGYTVYSNTPDSSKSFNWAVLHQKSSGKLIAVGDTHYWWMYFGDPEHDAIRVSNAKEMTKTAEYIEQKYNCPVVGFGDLNSRFTMPSLGAIRDGGWLFARDHAEETTGISTHHGDPVRGEDGKYHGSLTTDDYHASIDHIVYRGAIKPIRFDVVLDREALDSSDHSPIYCDFDIL